MKAARKPLLYHVAAALALLTLTLVQLSAQDETNVVNQRIAVSNREETVHIGNEQTNNYHLEENNYKPTQNTHVTVNVGKVKGKDLIKMRKHRPPSAEEMSLKSRMMEVYEHAKEEAKSALSEHGMEKKLLHFEHLGRILNALNPKYIATKRVWRAAFADPSNPEAEVVAPERDLESIFVGSDTPALRPLELSLGEGRPSVIGQLDQLANKFQDTINWDKSFVQKLFDIPDSEVSASQLAFKKLLQCLTYPLFCNKMTGRGPESFDLSDEDEQAATSALKQRPLKERFIRMPPPQEVPLAQHPVRKLVPSLPQLPPVLAPQEEEEPEEEEPEEEEPEEEGEVEGLEYEPAPVRAPPLSRRRFAPEPGGPASGGYNPSPQRYPLAQGYPPQRYQKEQMPHYGYQAKARMQPQAQPPMRSLSPPRLVQKYGPKYDDERRILG